LLIIKPINTHWFVGLLVEKKGFDVLIGTCIELKRMGKSFVLEIAGDGPLDDKLKQQVATYQLDNHVKFLGVLSHESVRQWMQSLDIFS